MFKNDSESIKLLLAAEKKAEEKVNQARKRKHLRLKQAKEEALAEIAKIKEEREKDFKEYEAKHLGSKESDELKMEKETDKLLSELNKFVRLNKDQVVDCFLDLVFNISCEVHINFKAAID